MKNLVIQGLISAEGVEKLTLDGVKIIWYGPRSTLPEQITQSDVGHKYYLRGPVPIEKCSFIEKGVETDVIIPLYYCIRCFFSSSNCSFEIGRDPTGDTISGWRFLMRVPEKQIIPQRFNSLLKHCSLASSSVN